MKKWILVFAVLLTTTLTASAFGPKLGVTGGYNLSWTKVNSSAFRNMVDGKSGAGWFIGPKVDFDLLLGLHLDGALVYNQRKFTVAQEGKADFSKTYSSLDVPVNAKYRFTISGIGVYASTGPQFSFSMGSKNISVSNWEIQDGATPVFKRSNLSTTWNFGAGVVWPRILNWAWATTWRSVSPANRFLRRSALASAKWPCLTIDSTPSISKLPTTSNSKISNFS